MDKLQKLINSLDKSTRSALINNQLNSIPKRYSLIKTMNTVHEFNDVKGKFYTFEDDNVILKEMNIRTVIYDTLSSISTNTIKQMLVFDTEGRLVSNSRIKLIMNERCSILTPLDDIELSYCYICQNKIVYDENLTKDGDYQVYFKEGLLINKFEPGCIGINFDLYCEVGNTDNGFIVSKIDREYNVFIDNIFMFKDGFHLDIDITENLSNVFRVDNTEGEYSYMIVYSKEEKSIDNIVRYTKNINIVKDILNNINLPEYINLIQKDFDFRYDPELSPEDNKELVLQEILQYSHQNLDRLFTEDNQYILKQFNGKELKRYVSNNNIWIVPRLRVNGNINTYVIVFYNGELLDGYNDIKYIANNIMVPIIKSRLKDTDIIEVMYFTDVMNNEFEVTLSEGQEFNYKHLASNMKDVLFYSSELDGNHIYDLEQNVEREYIIPYRYINNTDVSANVFFDNQFYHNKTVKAVSKRQFKHMKYQFPRENKFEFNYKWYDISTYFDINDEPNSEYRFDSLFTTETPGVTLGGSGTIKEQSMSFGDVVNDVYKHPTPLFLPEDNYSIHMYGYIFAEYDSNYIINIPTTRGCKVKIDDVDYCLDLEGQSIINLYDSKNTATVFLTRGYHKIDLFSYKHKKIAGVTFSWKRDTDYTFTIVPSNIIYKKEPDMKVLKLFNSIFRYCTNKYQYILFANNRRLDNKEAIFKFCGIDQVYDANYLILNRAFEEETIIDIIYTPIPVMEVYNEEKLSNNKGFITIDKYKLGHTLSPEYCSVFINGKKIPSSNMSNINADTMRIDVNTKTRSNLTILKHNIYQNVLSDLFISSHDAWTEATKMMNESELESLLGSSNYITDDEQDIMNLIYSEDYILWNIINNFWIKRFNVVDAEKLFHYNDEPKFLKRVYNNIPKFRSNEEYHDTNASINIYNDDESGYDIYEYTCTKDTESINPSAEVSFGDFKNMVISKPYSISANVWINCNINSQFQDRFYVRLYNRYTGRYVEYRMSYLENHPAQLSDIPKCYWVRLYMNNIKLTSDYDCIKIVCKLYHNKERVRFYNEVILEQYNCCTEGIEILPIDCEVITGCQLPYTEI